MNEQFKGLGVAREEGEELENTMVLKNGTHTRAHQFEDGVAWPAGMYKEPVQPALIQAYRAYSVQARNKC